MGYYVSAVESNLVVNKKRAINCIKKLMEGSRSYAWVNNKNVERAVFLECLGSALNEFGYDIVDNPDNEEEAQIYKECDSKWGDDEELLLGLTDAYSRECLIGFRGEDGGFTVRSSVMLEPAGSMSKVRS